MARSNPDTDTVATFWEHLAELRTRILVSVGALLVGFIASWSYREEIFALLTRPVREGLSAHGIHRLTAIETVEAMVVYLKMSVASGIVLAVPVMLYQLWAFVKPGLMPRERRPMRRVAILAVFMFAVGLVFCYRIVLPMVIDFLTAFTLGSGGVDFQVTMKSAYSTAIAFLVGFGTIFELPLVMVLLAATPLFDSKKYMRWTRYFMVLSFVIGALLTPPDVVSQILMAVPMVGLYFVGIGLTIMMERRREKGGGVEKGFDWQLVGAAGVLVGLLVVLCWPVQRPITAYLPWGARAVAAAGTSGKGVAPCTLDLGISLGSPVCAVYPEGRLVLGHAGQSTGQCFDGRLAGLELACVEADGWIAAGNQLLLARFVSNWKQGIEDSDPLKPAEGARFRVFFSLDATTREHRSYVQVSGVEDGAPHLEVSMVFPDPADALHFSQALEEKMPVKSGDGASLASEDPVAAAVEELAAAVESLAPFGQTSEARQVLAHVEAARKLLATRQEPAPPLAACSSIQCAWTEISPLLPEPTAIEQKSRSLNLTIPVENTDQLDALGQTLSRAAIPE